MYVPGNQKLLQINVRICFDEAEHSLFNGLVKNRRS